MSTLHLPVLHLDDDLVAIDKPIAMPTHAPQADPFPGDVVSALRRQLGVDYLGVHQRLDADTSGVMVFALRPEANGALAEAFASRSARKHYVALVHGVPTPHSGTIDLPLAPAPGGRRAVAAPDDRLAQPASTRYEVRAVAPDGARALVDLHPATGRTHQLRVHLAAIGTPIVGDPLYDAARPFPRLMLHAASLELPDAGGARHVFTAPLPFGFDESLAATMLTPELALRLAIERRRPLAGGRGTTAYHLVNGRGDGLDGIIVDRFGDRCIVDVRDRGMLDLVRAALARHDPPLVVDDPVSAAIDGLDHLVARGQGSVAPTTRHRETVTRVRAWCEGRRVLACGVAAAGLALAAQSTAADLLVVERSRAVLAWLRRSIEHAAASSLAPGLVAGALHEQLERLVRRERSFEVVLVDVRAVAAQAPHGARSIEHVAELALRLTGQGGCAILLLDDPHVTRRAYRRRVADALSAAGIDATLAATYGAPPLDHPATAGEENALKVLVVGR